jgi:hypothetical protein
MKGVHMTQLFSRRTYGAVLLAAAGMMALSPVQTGAAFLAAGTAALSASPALAFGKLKGKVGSVGDKGTVIRSLSDGSVIVVPVDPNGEMRLTGLQPGDYEIASLRLTAAAPLRPTSRPTSLHVDDDGRLAFAMRKLGKRAEAIPFDGPDGIIPIEAVMLDVQRSFAILPPPPCDPLPGRPDTCNRTAQRNHIDVNASTATDIVRLAPTTTTEAADVIVAERTKNGAYKSLSDFAQRVCPKARIDFDDVPVRFGETRIVMHRGGEPKSQGWKCAPGKDGGKGEASLFWVTFPFGYMGLWLATRL